MQKGTQSQGRVTFNTNSEFGCAGYRVWAWVNIAMSADVQAGRISNIDRIPDMQAGEFDMFTEVQVGRCPIFPQTQVLHAAGTSTFPRSQVTNPCRFQVFPGLQVSNASRFRQLHRFLDSESHSSPRGSDCVSCRAFNVRCFESILFPN